MKTVYYGAAKSLIFISDPFWSRDPYPPGTLHNQLKKNLEVDIYGKPIITEPEISINFNYAEFSENDNTAKPAASLDVLFISYDYARTQEEAAKAIVRKITIGLSGGLNYARTSAEFEGTGIFSAFKLALGADCVSNNHVDVFKFFDSTIKPALNRDTQTGIGEKSVKVRYRSVLPQQCTV